MYDLKKKEEGRHGKKRKKKKNKKEKKIGVAESLTKLDRLL